MYVYCMFCETQRCKTIAKLMEIRGAFRSFSPQIVRKQRKKGVNKEVLFDLLPGYVFVFNGARTAKGVPDMARRIDGRAPELRILTFYVVIASSFAFALGIDKFKVVSFFEVS